MRLMIEVDDAIEVVQDVVSLPLDMFSSLCDMLEANAVDAEPVVHGKWEEYLYGKCLMCTACKAAFFDENGNGGSNYCPNCGAKMDLEGE